MPWPETAPRAAFKPHLGSRKNDAHGRSMPAAAALCLGEMKLSTKTTMMYCPVIGRPHNVRPPKRPTRFHEGWQTYYAAVLCVQGRLLYIGGAGALSSPNL